MCDNFLYVFKGALRAPGRAGRRPCESAARQRRWLSIGASSARSWLATRGPSRDGRRLPSLGPSGHVGAGAHSPRRPTARAARRDVSCGARCCKRGWPGRLRQVHAFFRNRSPGQMLATAALWTSPWLPPGYEQNFWDAALALDG